MSQKRLKTCPVYVKQENESQDDLEDNRTISLFPDVFKCLAKWNKANNNYFNLDNNQLSFPWVLRLVCSEWNNAIEKYFQIIETTGYFKDEYQVKIDSGNCTQVQKLNHMFSKFGQAYVWFWLDIRNTQESYANFYLAIAQLLQYLPNLKHLEIRYESQIHTAFNINPQHYTDLDKKIQETPCPTWNKLETLIVLGNMPNEIVNELLSKGNHISKFQQIDQMNQDQSLDFSIDLPNLKDLNILIPGELDFVQLKLFGMKWKLEKCRCDFSKFSKRDYFNWSEIFEMIGDNWSSTLEDLDIRFPKVTSLLWSPGPEIREEAILKLTTDSRLNLPKLRTIEIFATTAFSLDFLLPAVGSLESIFVISVANRDAAFEKQRNLYQETKDRQLVEYLGFEKNMQNSNIWTWFYKLKWIKCSKETAYRPDQYSTE